MEWALPWFGMFALLVMSTVMLLSPQGIAHGLPLLLIGVAAWFMRKRVPRYAIGLSLWVFLAYIADLFAWKWSKVRISPEEATMTWGGWPSAYRAGYPIHAVELPMPPLGPGNNEWREIAVIVPNLLAWLAVAAVVTAVTYALLEKPLAKAPPQPRLWWILLLGAFLMNQAFLAMWMIWFD